jgi:PAS domain S-box-containing protein
VSRREGLAESLRDGPTAALVVDRVTGNVLAANAQARSWADLPADELPLAEWAARAGFRAADEDDDLWAWLVTSAPRHGRLVSLRHDPPGRTRVDDEYSLWWAAAWPLIAGREGDHEVVVVLLPLPVKPDSPDRPRRGPAGAATYIPQQGRDEADLHRNATTATSLSFTIADVRLPDSPLVYVNPAFEQTTGYRADQILGRNCRLLQGPGTDRGTVARIGRAVRTGRHTTETLLNYRSDGRPFWNRLSLSPVLDGRGALTHMVGIQSDVTIEVELEQERGRALAEAQNARAQAEQARRELAFLADFSDQVATGGLSERVHRLAEVLVPTIGDAAAVRIAFEPAQPSRAWAGPLGSPDGAEELLDNAALALPYHGRVGVAHTPTGTVLAAPVMSGDGRVVGTIAVRQFPGRLLERHQVELLDQVVRRSGTKLENAWLAELSHRRALDLQQSLLPTLPEVPGLELSAAYVPGSRGAAVGGDWYDVLPLPDGTIGLAIGDVMGHDMIAAAAMGQLRSVLRSYAWEGTEPGQVIDRLNRLVTGLAMAQLASCVYARLDAAEPDGARRLTYAVAGHPPPLVVDPDGRVRRLEDASSPLIGIELDADAARPAGHTLLAPGSLLLLYTDGAVETRRQDIDTGIERLGGWLAAHRSSPVEAIRKDLVDVTTRREMLDDLCLLLVRVR